MFHFKSNHHEHTLKHTDEVLTLSYRQDQRCFSFHWVYTCQHTLGSGCRASKTLLISGLTTAARQTLLYIHSKHYRTTNVSNTSVLVSKNSNFHFNLQNFLAFLKSPRSFLYGNSIFLLMNNTSQADFC